MSRGKRIQKDDLKSVLFMVILFVSIVGGRELGNFLASYREISRLKVYFDVQEDELSRYLRETLDNRETGLEIGYSISSPLADNSIDLVTTTPDYVKRWLIGLTVSPIVVNQPEASDVELEMLVEGQLVDQDLYTFPKEKISYLGLVDRRIQIEIDDTELLREIVSQASETYGGEVKVEFSGRVNVHLLFLDTWLPFQVTRHTLVRIPFLEYVSSGWRNYDSETVERLDPDDLGYVLLELNNPTRIHSLQKELTCEFYRDGDDSLLFSVTKDVSMPPLKKGQYVFQFQFNEKGTYRYRLLSGENVLQELTESPPLVID